MCNFILFNISKMVNYLYNSNLFHSYFKIPNKDYLENGYNILSQKYIIETPQLYELRKDVYIIKANKKLLNKILNKEDISHKDVKNVETVEKVIASISQ